jgi:predicted metal-dependent hydrolase
VQSVERIRAVYEEAFRFYHPRKRVPPVHVSFYPYVGINHTIRIRNGEVFVRIGEICREMPLGPHRGLAYVLTGKLLRKKIPDDARAVYEKYIDSDAIRRQAVQSKKARGRKVITTSKGEVYDLDEIFQAVNKRYFGSWIRKPMLTWSAKKTYRILGHHDATHDHVAISRSLDSKQVPRFIVEYVLFHEMLHIAHPPKHINGRRYYHTPEFKRDERRFERYDEAERWIEQNVRKLKREAKRG